MMVFTMLVGILLAILGVASASPIATATTPDGATGVVIGPRRNGYRDLPSSVLEYNDDEYANAIPNFVTASDPERGENALIYNRDEIYNALREGYEVLQRYRDPIPGQLQAYGNRLYPAQIIPDFEGLAQTHYGRFGRIANINMFMWPLVWTNGWTGHNQNPGLDRIVFNENGVYLGVITRRPSSRSPTGGYRWCPPTDMQGRWTARWIGHTRGWTYTGVPPDGIGGYTAPLLFNVAEYLRNFWWQQNPGGHPPFGSHDIQLNSSNPPPVNMAPGAQFDDDDPLQFPPADNSTGVWRAYVPSNTTSDLTNEFVAADCTFAHNHGAGAYQQSCQTHWTRGSKSMKVRITISGSGQHTHGWCKGVIDNMHKKCGGNFNLVDGQYACDEKYPGTATFSKATDPSDPERGKYYFGIDMHFWLQWHWEESDADHACMSDAVEAGSCGRGNVKSQNGKWCRNINWIPNDPPLLEWSNDLGPA